MDSDESAPSVEDAIRVLNNLAVALDVPSATTTRGVVDVATALEMISSMERVSTRLLRNPAVQAVSPEVRASRADLMGSDLARQRSRLTLMTSQISRIRTTQTINELADSIPRMTTSLGYERSLFSWVKGGRWIPRSAHTWNDPGLGQAMLAAGGPPYQEVGPLYEARLIRDRAPMLVLEATDSPRVHPTIMPIARSVTYVAGPILVHGHVMGMLHADRNLETGLNDEFDRVLLGLFCESIGAAIERLMQASPTSAPRSPVEAEGRLDTLTQREVEVLRLIAEGLTNAEISAQLYISHETTKSHVKSLLRKLGVNNRSRAGAIYTKTRTD